jgi:hypothetical protein
MTSEQLADQVEAVIRSVKERIVGTGKEQYDLGGTQKIELKSEPQILRETLEELDDAIVYLAHLRARVAHLRIK